MTLVSGKNKNLGSVARALRYSGIETPEERRQVIKRINFYAKPSQAIAKSLAFLSGFEFIFMNSPIIDRKPIYHALIYVGFLMTLIHGMGNSNNSNYLVNHAEEIVSEQRRRLSKDYVQDNRSDGETDLSTYLDKAKSFGLGGILR
ncbi:MAG: hypothetical protein AABY10_06105 [Nanoarchaeota archaeon]